MECLCYLSSVFLATKVQSRKSRGGEDVDGTHILATQSNYENFVVTVWFLVLVFHTVTLSYSVFAILMEYHSWVT
jgi:hypothetical protein